jgi:opine dehydrogenase
VETSSAMSGDAKNGAHQMAVDLTLRGFDIILCEHPSFEKSFKSTLESGKIESIGLIEGTAKIHMITMNFKEALESAELVYLVVPAIAHETFFDSMIPLLKDGHLVVIWAGDGGALRLAKRMKEEAPEKKILIAETNTIPYGTRRVGPSKVDLFVKAQKILISAFPAKETKKALELVKESFPVVESADSILSVSFSNPNPTVHPPGTLLNVGRIQWSKGEFYLYREGITEAPARIIRKVYDETLAVATAFGFKMREFKDEQFRNPCSIMNVDFWAPFDKNGIVAEMRGPSQINNRYITEDLPYGLVQRSQLGLLVDIPTPIIDSIIHLGSGICEIDFWKGRTLEDLGLAGMTKEEIMRYLQDGI